MITKNQWVAACLVAISLMVMMAGCSESKITFGEWKVQGEKHVYVLLNEEDARRLGEIPPAPFPSDNKKGWVRVKNIGEKPTIIKDSLRPYSVAVLESGFAFLQSTHIKSKNESYEDIEWAWRIIVENRSKRGICAYGGSALFDQDGFVLAKAGSDWDNSEDGVYIKPGGREVIQGRTIWRVNSETHPPTLSRVSRSDYKLFLRNADIFDEAFGSK